MKTNRLNYERLLRAAIHRGNKNRAIYWWAKLKARLEPSK